MQVFEPCCIPVLGAARPAQAGHREPPERARKRILQRTGGRGQSRIMLNWSPQARAPSACVVQTCTLMRSTPPGRSGLPMVKL